MLKVKKYVEIFDKEKIKSIIEEICNPKNCNIVIRSKSFDGKTDRVEQWLETKFSVEDIPSSLFAKMQNPNICFKDVKMTLPPPNNLIPKNFEILDKNEKLSTKPEMVRKWPEAELWYKKDDKFKKPKAIVNMKLFTKDSGFGTSISGRVFVSIWLDVMKECMREFNYDAEMAHLEFSAALKLNNLDLKWSGFNDSLTNYVLQTLKTMKSAKG